MKGLIFLFYMIMIRPVFMVTKCTTGNITTLIKYYYYNITIIILLLLLLLLFDIINVIIIIIQYGMVFDSSYKF